ncbi:hypothetical protein [Amycolatopsis sp. Hca4]|uniref:hypothetical protein n=1 Tax=Amycolatopsis sp. Hca4 TaxID=2742131 RepID=UPI00159272AB|nr:hypothetical protein [Amycolatopsis sp. Hca4]QKV75307.1 hypothetical protein HUT10_17155 [Amycolatopsis sp. Hca4]
MEILWTLVIIVLVAWAIFTQVGARRQLDVTVPLSEQDAAQVVVDHFGVTWSQVEGLGHLNFRPRLRMHAPTLSVTFEPNGTSSCLVSIWTSHGRKHYGMMGHAQLAWRKKASLANRLRAATSQPQNWAKGA